MNVRHPKFSIWAASCIAIGLAIAYSDGISARDLVGSALLMSSVICTAIAITWLYRVLKRKPPSDKRS